jgi:hypothetical protein
MKSMHTGFLKIKELAYVGHHFSRMCIAFTIIRKGPIAQEKGVRMVVSWTKSFQAEKKARIGYTADNQLLSRRIDMAEQLSFRKVK